jgi:hypothetical protein
MAATRSTSKLSRQWVRQTRRYFLPFLDATRFPSVERHGQRGKTCEYPAWLIMLIGVLAVKGKEQTYLGLHRMTCRCWQALCGRQVQLPPSSESQLRERLKKIGFQPGKPPGSVVQICPAGYLEASDEWR